MCVSAGMSEKPRKPNFASASFHAEVPLNSKNPDDGRWLLSGRTMFMPWLSHWYF